MKKLKTPVPHLTSEPPLQAICKNCYKLFSPLRKNRSKFCTPACRQAAYRDRRLARKIGR